MRLEQWERFKGAAKRRGPTRPVPVAVIVDSPWLAAHYCRSHLDYYFDPQTWFDTHRRFIDEFPELIPIPSWWAEVGMAAEPSALGVRIRLFHDRTPSEQHLPIPLEHLDELVAPDPVTDGFCPVILHRYATFAPRILEAGYTIPMVAARGPLCLASFFRTVTGLMLDMVDDPERTGRLLDLCTDLVIGWLRAQAAAIGPCVEGILVLDDIVGLVGRAHYEEYVHPRLARICAAFPSEWVKVYHNDADVSACLERLPDAGFDALNWGQHPDLGSACARLGGRMTLMGNVPPLDVCARGSVGDVARAAREVVEVAGEHPLILSVGGGVSPGTPAENLRALALGAAGEGG